MGNDWGIWLVIIAAGLATFLTRLSFIAAHGRIYPPAWFSRALTFVPVAVLSAIIAPDLLVRDGHPIVTVANPQLLAGACAALVAWRSKSVWLTIGVGMVVMFGLQGFLGLR